MTALPGLVTLPVLGATSPQTPRFSCTPSFSTDSPWARCKAPGGERSVLVNIVSTVPWKLCRAQGPERMCSSMASVWTLSHWGC